MIPQPLLLHFCMALCLAAHSIAPLSAHDSNSTRWPPQLPATQYVHMQVIHTLTPILAIIDHHPIPTIQPRLSRHPPRHHQQVAQQLLVAVIAGGQLCEWLLWYDEEVCWCLWVGVVEGDCLVVLVDELGWDLMTSDLHTAPVGRAE